VIGALFTTEPPRGSQICGYQIRVGGHPSGDRFCGKPKIKGLYFCREHHDWLADDEPDGVIRMARGNAVGTGDADRYARDHQRHAVKENRR